MTSPPFREGDFVWCAFPEHENPVQPGPLHLAYALAVSSSATTGGRQEVSVLLAYTTTRPWLDPTRPRGVFVFDRQEAARLGQTRAFVMDLRRLAAVPVTPLWFPRLDQAGSGVQGRMPKQQQRQYLQIVEYLLTRRPEIIERLGPLWPGTRR